jgi:hypothetical protein
MRPDGPAPKIWRVTVTDGVEDEVITVLSDNRESASRVARTVWALHLRIDRDSILVTNIMSEDPSAERDHIEEDDPWRA